MGTSDFVDLKLMLETAGGQKTLKDVRSITTATIATLANTYRDKTPAELIALCAKLEAHLSLLTLLTGIDDQIEQIKLLYPE